MTAGMKTGEDLDGREINEIDIKDWGLEKMAEELRRLETEMARYRDENNALRKTLKNAEGLAEYIEELENLLAAREATIAVQAGEIDALKKLLEQPPLFIQPASSGVKAMEARVRRGEIPTDKEIFDATGIHPIPG